MAKSNCDIKRTKAEHTEQVGIPTLETIFTNNVARTRHFVQPVTSCHALLGDLPHESDEDGVGWGYRGVTQIHIIFYPSEWSSRIAPYQRTYAFTAG